MAREWRLGAHLKQIKNAIQESNVRASQLIFRNVKHFSKAERNKLLIEMKRKMRNYHDDEIAATSLISFATLCEVLRWFERKPLIFSARELLMLQRAFGKSRVSFPI